MKKINRREFLKNAALFSSVMILPSLATGRVKGANERLQTAIVGWGGQGKSTVNSLLKSPNAEIVALCDVDEVRVKNSYMRKGDKEKFLDKLEKVEKFKDYRVMLDKMDKQIDGVCVCTPDFSHYPIAAWAIAKGKHVFCEKPLTRTIWEGRELRRLAKEAGVYTQMGNQVHTNDGWRTIREWFDSGIMGEVEDIYAWTDRDFGFNTPPKPSEKIPSTLDYNLWLNVSQYEPYSADMLPFKWRGLRKYGTGSAGDMGCHFLDNPYSAFNLGSPFKVVADALPAKDFSWPKASSIDMFFKNKYGKDGIVKLHWYDGLRRPKEIKRVSDKELNDPRARNCIYIVGTKHTMTLNYTGHGVRLTNREAFIDLKKSGKIPPKTIPRNKFPFNPQGDWANACVEGRMPESNFEYASPFSEIVLLNALASIHPGVELMYNPNTMTFTNYPEANKYIRSLYAYRKEFLPSAVNL
ncbi:MAG: Gfo/Idh/MocA family oxidoreductase [Verrucomicrobiaceae bacterium]|nr:Gfo/Idh/MocA family oxidoreductase [Verrucomicrobiaceae bacterium]